jgi:hypothetical protein
MPGTKELVSQRSAAKVHDVIKRLLREHPFLVGAFAVSYLGAIAAKIIGVPRDIVLGLGLPALVLSGWAALGHLITLDDDYPGEWSNPERSKGIWRASLIEMLGRVSVFALLLLVLAL